MASMVELRERAEKEKRQAQAWKLQEEIEL